MIHCIRVAAVVDGYTARRCPHPQVPWVGICPVSVAVAIGREVSERGDVDGAHEPVHVDLYIHGASGKQHDEVSERGV